MKVLVTGGSGFVGKELLKKLVEQNFSVRVLTRDSGKTFPKGIEVILGDLANGSDLDFDSIADECDVIFHCAGEVKNIKKMRKLHVRGTKLLLRSVINSIQKERTAKHWVQLSSVGAYGPPKLSGLARVVTEKTRENPVGEYEITKTLADNLIIEFSDELLTYTILRPSNIVGLEMQNTSFKSLLSAIRKKYFFYIGSRDVIATYIHVNDVVKALITCAINKKAKNEIFNLSNDCKLSEIVSALSIASKTPTYRICLNEKFVRLLLNIVPPFIKIPLTPTRIDSLVAQTHYSNLKIRKILHFIPSVSIPKFSVHIINFFTDAK
jgi:nucleoside-diphosphate-sugar epimerase